MSTNEHDKFSGSGTIKFNGFHFGILLIFAGLLTGILLNTKTIINVLNNHFITQDEYAELCAHLGGTVVYSALNYPDCLR